jgi:hypothetical protein
MEMPVERGTIREYAIATGSHHPDYLDNPRAPIPSTFLSTWCSGMSQVAA